MQIGVVFPQTEIESDVGAIRAYAQGAETLGYAHLMAYEHVVGADPVVHSPWDGPYDVTSTFQELFVLYGYLAAATSLELVTGVLVLPQRQTTLVAKQAAQVDQLTNGRFRLGVGVGWNTVEYQALGKEFGNRGKRIEEQIPLLRRLWTEDSVTFDGTYERGSGQASTHYRYSGRSRSGWAAAPTPPTIAWADSPMAGYPRWSRDPTSTMPGLRWRTPPPAQAATRPHWECTDVSSGPTTCPACSAASRRGGPPAPPT